MELKYLYSLFSDQNHQVVGKRKAEMIETLHDVVREFEVVLMETGAAVSFS